MLNVKMFEYLPLITSLGVQDYVRIPHPIFLVPIIYSIGFIIIFR